MKELNISIVIPCYNEEKRIVYTVESIDNYLKAKKIPGEIIVVDDGSIDQSASIIKQIKTFNEFQIIEHKINSGKGAAVKRGVSTAKNNLILFSDSDLSTPIEELDKFIPFIKEGYDIVIASRDMPESVLNPPQPFHRRIIGFLCKSAVRLLVLNGIKDTQCGFKLFTHNSAKVLFADSEIDRYAFDIEILSMAQKKRYEN